MSERLFHLMLPGAFESWQASGADELAPPSLASEGFVHLSFANQLAGTLEAHFAAYSTVLIFEVELASAEALVLEPSRGGALFPHLRRALGRPELARHWRATNTTGHPTDWRLPSLQPCDAE